MLNSLCGNAIGEVVGGSVTVLRGSARVLWWNTQEYAREGGS